MTEQEEMGYNRGYLQCQKEMEPVRKAARLFEQAANDWMQRALKAEAELEKLHAG